MTRARRAAAALALLLAGAGAGATSLTYCTRPARLQAAQQDRLFRMAGIVRATLQAEAGAAAIVSRSGQDLKRFGQRYSHAGVALRGAEPAFSVRQLYFDCDERQPRLFDQGVVGFVLSSGERASAWVSIVLLPPSTAAALAARAADNAAALALLGAAYSANAYPFATRYQNCNQWLAELLAGALGDTANDRAAAQGWLAANGYVPTLFDASPLLLVLARPFVPWLHDDDHPADDLEAHRYRVSMPASIEAFVREHVPGAERIELCQRGGRVVVHRGWLPVADGCIAGSGDDIVVLDGG